MKEKFLQFFTGKMSKSIYISIAAAVVCGAVVITSAVVVHDKNQQVDAVLESLSASESMTESVSESAEESVSESSNTESNQQAQAANNEPAGDKALQYLAEYDKLTAEYQAKRAELEEQKKSVPLDLATTIAMPAKPAKRISENSNQQAEYDKEYESCLAEWEIEYSSCEEKNSESIQKAEIANQRRQSIQKQINELDVQYEKDVTELKARYGIE